MDEYRIRGLLKRIDEPAPRGRGASSKARAKPLPKPSPSRLPRSCRVVLASAPASLIADWLSVRDASPRRA